MEKSKPVNGASEFVTSLVLLAGSCGWPVSKMVCLGSPSAGGLYICKLYENHNLPLCNSSN